MFLKMDDIDWNVFNETKLFEAMVDHKPVGVNKYFQMVLIWHKLQEYIDVSSDKIWSHLETMYNLESLDDIESLPFPNDEKDFHLPDSEYASLKAKKDQEKAEEKAKVIPVKKPEPKEVTKITKEVKKEDKTPKKDTKDNVQRRDSKDGKEVKTPVNTNKKELRKDSEKKPLSVKGKAGTSKEVEKLKTPKNDETPTPNSRAVNKRPTRLSTKPDESPKSQSPLTVTPTTTKRRRI